MKSLLLLFLISSTISWKPQFAGHRGGYTGVENTVEAYRNGVDKYGYAGLECDIRVTKDNQYVIWHDEVLKGDKGEMTITETTLEVLKTNKLTQTRGGVTYTGYICTTEEYLQIVKEKGVFPIIELKWTKGINSNDMSMYPGLADLVKKYDLQDKAIFLTSMAKSIEYIRKNYPTFTCQYLMYSLNDDRYEFCKKWQVNPSIRRDGINKADVQKIHNIGLETAAWTINTKDVYMELAPIGVFMMTCDYLYPKDMPEVEPPWK